MREARRAAQRNSSLVEATTDLMAAQAAVFQPPPRDEEATATRLGEGDIVEGIVRVVQLDPRPRDAYAG